jgi:CRP/FNR family cyclic AMP-dependent transcriptional regulator
MSWVDIVGYSAALAVLAAFCMSSIVPLRIVAILSNVLFALYGLSAHLYPVFLLHSILLPINVFKLTHVELLPRNGRGMVGNRFWSRPPFQKESR